MTRFPWGELMQLGLHVLKLPPEHFWRMTMRELICPRSTALTQARLEELMQKFPD
jgi:uncharacterized phage protein (TIGR02216 family)